MVDNVAVLAHGRNTSRTRRAISSAGTSAGSNAIVPVARRLAESMRRTSEASVAAVPADVGAEAVRDSGTAGAGLDARA